MSADRGRCRVCGTSQRLDVDGRLAHHWHRPFLDQPDAVESCAGAGYLPAVDQAPEGKGYWRGSAEAGRG